MKRQRTTDPKRLADAIEAARKPHPPASRMTVATGAQPSGISVTPSNAAADTPPPATPAEIAAAKRG